MAKAGTVIGGKIGCDERSALIRRFPPRYADIVADHVTLASGADNLQLPALVHAPIVGRGDDDHGLEAMVVAIGGATDRPDGPPITSPGP